MLKRLRDRCSDSYVEGGFMFGLTAYLVGSALWFFALLLAVEVADATR